MGKKYIIELEDNESVYKTIIANGYPMLQVIVPAPYTEPDMEQVRKEAYDKGYEDATEEIGSDEQAIADKAYKKGLSDAWEAARKVVGLEIVNRRKVFGTEYMYSILEKNTATEAIDKIRQYEQEKEEIKVGDEVIVRDKTAVVTEITDRYVRIMFSGGNSYALFSKGVVKTGRHFHEIAEVLAKMKETNNG